MRRLTELGWSFFWITSVTLGGGMAMLPLLDREFVERRGWMTEQEMLDVVAVMQSLPGIIAINMAVLIGYRIKGVGGALTAVVASGITPFVIIAIIAGMMSGLGESQAVNNAFLGVRAGTAALVTLSLTRLAKAALGDWFAWAIAAIAFVATVIVRVEVTTVVLSGIALGLVMNVSNGMRRAK